MPAYPIRVSAAFGRSRGVNDGMRLSQTIRPGKRHDRNLVPILSASVGGRTPSPRMIADVREPPGVRTRRLPPHHFGACNAHRS
jgi:hypothetical protein